MKMKNHIYNPDAQTPTAPKGLFFGAQMAQDPPSLHPPWESCDWLLSGPFPSVSGSPQVLVAVLLSVHFLTQAP